MVRTGIALFGRSTESRFYARAALWMRSLTAARVISR
jgi:hypothetical protein